MDRRSFLFSASAAAAAGVLVTSCQDEPAKPAIVSGDEWDSVRNQFALVGDKIDLSAMFIASHPKPVREAIDRYRQELDQNPTSYLREQLNRHENEVLQAVAEYLRADPAEIALTDSTTMGLGLVYNGLKLSPGQQILTTVHDYYATHESLRLAAERSGAQVREIQLYRQELNISVDEIVSNIRNALVPETRVLALTWVHSSTGLKLPLQEISSVVAEANAKRDEQQKILTCIDGVHGFGVEDLAIKETGCDFFMAGCHKWLFGPRGTGIVWGNKRAWDATNPIIPTFMDDEVRNAWMRDDEPSGRTTAKQMTPGGFKAFEHQWAMAAAFKFHLDIGKAKIAARTHELGRQCKEGLAGMSHVKLYTPRDEKLSAGIVCFDIEGMPARDAVARCGNEELLPPQRLMRDHMLA